LSIYLSMARELLWHAERENLLRQGFKLQSRSQFRRVHMFSDIAGNCG